MVGLEKPALLTIPGVDAQIIAAPRAPPDPDHPMSAVVYLEENRFVGCGEMAPDDRINSAVITVDKLHTGKVKMCPDYQTVLGEVGGVVGDGWRITVTAEIRGEHGDARGYASKSSQSQVTAP